MVSKYSLIDTLNLSCDGGGGAQSAPLIFICENNRTVLKKQYLIGSFKDKDIFHVILEIDRELREKKT